MNKTALFQKLAMILQYVNLSFCNDASAVFENRRTVKTFFVLNDAHSAARQQIFRL